MGTNPLEKPDDLSKGVAKLVRLYMADQSPPMSQTDLSRATGISRSVLSRVLLAEREFDLSHIRRICTYFGVPVSSFLARAEEIRDHDGSLEATFDRIPYRGREVGRIGA